jgi:LysM repeat protein
MFEKMFSQPSNLNEWKKNNKPKEEAKSVSRSAEDIRKEKEKMIAKNKELRETVYSKNFEGANKITRRDFLKTGGALFGLLAMGKYEGVEKTLNVIAGEKNETNAACSIENEKETEKEDFEGEIYYDGEEPDIEAIKNIFNFNSKEHIEINLKTVDKLKDYWKYKYAGDMKSDLVGAMERITPFIPKLKDIFNEYGVPEKYALLAIPESHWKLDAVSRVDAEGPYQFMPATGKDYGLMTSADRRDPEKSARACAEFLKKLYSKTHDWDLALSGYNGGFMKRYLKKCKHEKTQPTYNKFLVFLTEKANRIKSEVRQKLFAWHTVVKKETLHDLAKKYNLNVNTICKHNKIKGMRLKVGQSIKIPISNVQKSEIFQNKIRDIAENLNYPPKLIAVFELVENTIAWNKGVNKDVRG